jgi:hypothetical protein
LLTSNASVIHCTKRTKTTWPRLENNLRRVCEFKFLIHKSDPGSLYLIGMGGLFIPPVVSLHHVFFVTGDQPHVFPDRITRFGLTHSLGKLCIVGQAATAQEFIDGFQTGRIVTVVDYVVYDDLTTFNSNSLSFRSMREIASI